MTLGDEETEFSVFPTSKIPTRKKYSTFQFSNYVIHTHLNYLTKCFLLIFNKKHLVIRSTVNLYSPLFKWNQHSAASRHHTQTPRCNLNSPRVTVNEAICYLHRVIFKADRDLFLNP